MDELQISFSFQGVSTKRFVLPGIDDHAAGESFERVSNAVLEESQFRYDQLTPRSLRHKGTGGIEDLNKWLKKVSYVIISHYIEIEASYVFSQRISKYRSAIRGSKGNPNIFQTGIFSILCAGDNYLDAKKRYLFGRQLWYAYRHYIPHFLLDGFVTQTGKNISGDIDRQIEPGFEEWIIDRRVKYYLEVPDLEDERSYAFEMRRAADEAAGYLNDSKFKRRVDATMSQKKLRAYRSVEFERRPSIDLE